MENDKMSYAEAVALEKTIQDALHVVSENKERDARGMPVDYENTSKILYRALVDAHNAILHYC